MKITQAFVLAGGKGKRLRPLTESIPKPLVKVCGRPILEYSVELLARHEVQEVILATGYMHEKIESHFGNGEKFGVHITYSVEKEPLGTGGALKAAQAMLDERFFMLNGDNIADFDLTKMANLHLKSKAKATLALSEVEDVAGFGVVKMLGNHITEFIEKPLPQIAPSKLVNAGAYILEKGSLSIMPEGFSLIEKTLFPALASSGMLCGFLHKGYWFTTDTHERLARAEKGLIQAAKH